MTDTTQQPQDTRSSNISSSEAQEAKRSDQPTLFVAVELSSKNWLVGSLTGHGNKPRRKNVKAGDFDALFAEFESAKTRFDLDPDCRVVCCYEAGRDGFYIHRTLAARGVENYVVDAASMQMSRRSRRAKSDRIDVDKMLRDLVNWTRGDTSVWRTVVVPPLEIEDERHVVRELQAMKKERTAHVNRIKGLLVTVGERIQVNQRFLWNLGEAAARNPFLGENLVARLRREHTRLQLLEEQIAELTKQEVETVTAAKNEVGKTAKLLTGLKGLGARSAYVFSLEAFGWRSFKNGKKVGSFWGLASSPFKSGNMDHDQGISRAGRAELRALAIEIAWSWVRFQPDSPLTKWFEERFGQGKRSRKVGIVAVARRLMVMLWLYTAHGVVAEGAIEN